MAMKKALALLLWLVVFCSTGWGFTLIDEEKQPAPALFQLFQTLSIPMENDLQAINHYLQTHFLRKSTEERWEMAPSPYESQWEALQPIFQSLGMTDNVKPTRSHYDYAIFNGQSVPMMRQQLEYLLDLQDSMGLSFGQALFLTGERPLSPRIDGGDALFSTVNTESAAARLLMEAYLSPRNIPWKIIAVPMYSGSGRRPNTEDTVRSWLGSAPPAGSILLFSTNPFISYQQETFYNSLARSGWFSHGGTLEACGKNIAKNGGASNHLAILLDNLARLFYTEMQRPLPPAAPAF